jgi:hypothetical protein
MHGRSETTRPELTSEGSVLPNCSFLNQGAARARRGRLRSACWRPPAGIGRRAGQPSNRSVTPTKAEIIR